MSQTKGYITWSPSFLLANYFLDGGLFVHQAWPISPEETLGVFAIPALDGSSQLQRPFRGGAAPIEYSRYSFPIDVLIKDFEDLVRFKMAKANQPVEFCYGGLAIDKFNAVNVSDQFTLSRPPATDGTVSGVDEISHPTVVLLDGTEDATAATVSGQTVTALKTGVIAVRYLPLFTVVFTDWKEPIEKTNALRVQCTLEEIIQGDFS